MERRGRVTTRHHPSQQLEPSGHRAKDKIDGPFLFGEEGRRYRETHLAIPSKLRWPYVRQILFRKTSGVLDQPRPGLRRLVTSARADRPRPAQPKCPSWTRS